MLLEKSLPCFLLLTLFAINCSGPSRTASVPAKPSDPNERLAKIKMTDLNGQPVSLKDFAGKPIFLNFWATWCGPCVNEMPSVEKASKLFKDDIVFLAVSDESPALIKSYVKKNKFSFNFAHLDVTYLDVYVKVLPTTLLIDGKGQLVEEEEGFRNWMDADSQEKLKSLIKK
ncbi:MAG: TlpA family protein disulfide reductase [Phycisphaerae bacterium]|nr:TlpA family protein disulfide reductase [Saprospiraceae bacterium]